MHIPCVVAITKDTVLGHALTNLINSSEVGFVVVESNANNLEELIEEINTNNADVILLEKSDPFAGEDMLTKLLMLYPRLLVIIANEENNWLHIYRREDILMTSTADLITAIRSA